MADAAEKMMTVDDFILWAEGREGKWELHDGLPVSMSPEKIVHSKVKYRVTRAFEEALAKSGVPCDFAVDGPAVRLDEYKSYQPDSLVYCDEDLSDDALEVEKPIIVVEVLSPSNASYDLRDKLQGYFQVPSIEHYLIVDPDKKLIIHHKRGEGEDIVTRFVSEGSIRLEPPGIEIAVSSVLASDASKEA